MTDKWYRSKVIKGHKLGRKIGFPTLNLDHPALLSGNKEGVYACRAKIEDKTYQGVLYFGPKLILGETKNTLEIHLFDFHKMITGKTILFQLKNFIRLPMNFPDLESLQKQLLSDCQKAKESLK